MLKKKNSHLINNGKIIFIKKDGRNGYTKYAPYKAIHVGACSEKMPYELIKQLDKNGRMFIPIGEKGKNQNIYIIDKDYFGNVTYESILSVRYGMLTDVYTQLNS